MRTRSAYQKLLHDQEQLIRRPKLYKAGKLWLVAGVTTVSIGLTGFLGTPAVHAATTDTDTTQVSATSTSASGTSSATANSVALTPAADSSSAANATSTSTATKTGSAASSATATTAATTEKQTTSTSTTSTQKTATKAVTSDNQVSSATPAAKTEVDSDSATTTAQPAAASQSKTALETDQASTTMPATTTNSEPTDTSDQTATVTALGAVSADAITQAKTEAADVYATTGVAQTLTAVAATTDLNYAAGITDADLVATLNADPTTTVPAGDAGTITYTYVNALTGETITEAHNPFTGSGKLTGTASDSYTTSSVGAAVNVAAYDINLMGYKLLSDTSTLAATNYAAGAYTATLYYLPLKDVDIEWVDTDGNTLLSFAMPARYANLDDPYDATTGNLTIPGYTLVSMPANVTGTFNQVETSLSDTAPVAVQFVYQKTATSDDELYTSVTTTDVNIGQTGLGWATRPGSTYDLDTDVTNQAEQLAIKEATGYTAFASQGNKSGIMSPNGINYFVWSLSNMPVTVNYVIDNHDGTTTTLYTTQLSNDNYDTGQYFPVGNYDTATTTAAAIADGNLNLTGVTLEKIDGSTTGTYGLFGPQVTYYYNKDTPAMTTSVVSKTVNYVDQDGTTLSPSTLELVGFTETTDPITGAVTVTPNKRTLGAVTLPTIPGYHVVASQDATDAQSGQVVTNTSGNLTYTVVYEKDAVTPPDNGGTGTTPGGTDTGTDTGSTPGNGADSDNQTGTDTNTDTDANTGTSTANPGDVTTGRQNDQTASNGKTTPTQQLATTISGDTASNAGRTEQTVTHDKAGAAASFDLSATSGDATAKDSRMTRYHNLPQTSENADNLGAVGLLGLLSATLGWFGLEKRRHN